MPWYSRGYLQYSLDKVPSFIKATAMLNSPCRLADALDPEMDVGWEKDIDREERQPWGVNNEFNMINQLLQDFLGRQEDK